MVRPGSASHLHRSILALCLLLVAQVSHAVAGSVRLYWDANTEQDLAGYVLVWGSSPGVYTQSATLAPDAVTHEVTSLPDGTWYFAIRAFNTTGLHSGYSNEVQVVIAAPAVSSPTLVGVSPASGSTAGGTSVTLSGTDFRAGAVVRFGGTVAAVSSISSTTIVATTPVRAAGTVSVSVTNPDGGMASLATAFTFVAPPVAPPVSTPSITGVSPASGPAAGGTDITITGTQFLPGAVVRLGGQLAAVQSQTSTVLVARTPAGPVGTTSVSVTNSDGGGVTLASAFTYQAPPTLSGVNPATGPTAGGTQVTLSGANFKAGLVVRFGSTVATIDSVTPSAVVVRTPAHPAGAVAITVQNPDGTSTQASQSFAYTAPPALPSISSFSPTSGTTAGGTEVVITGTNFQNGVVVRFGSLSASVSSVTTTRLVVRTPAQARGTVALSVLNPDGNGVQIDRAYTYRGKAPSVTTVSPSAGDASGGTQVVLDGADFEEGVSVSVNDVPAAVLSVTPTRVVVRMPPHAPAKVGLVVTNPDSQFTWVPAAFTYEDAGPAITHVSPATGATAGGTSVSIVGSGFVAGATVAFGGVPATVLSQESGVIVATAPAHEAGPVSILVRNPDGRTATAPGAYTYEDPSAPFVRYFAEGAAGSFFATRFALANPHAEAVAVEVTYTDTQGTATTQTVEVPGRGRVTLEASNRPALASEAFATVFSAPKVIGVERTMTWAAGGPAYGAHSDTGVAAPRTSWVLAEGATIGGFNTFYLLQNPTAETAQVKVQYLLADGERIERIHPVAPLSRTNIWVNKDDPALAAAEMSATVTSLNGVPVVVERSMYRNSATELFAAGHNSAAVDAPALRWFLAEGATGGTFDEFVLVANPNPVAAQLRVSYLRAGRAPLVKSYVAGPQSRLTIWVDQEAPELANAEVSVVVESLTPTPVVVERSMWWRADAAGEWVEAHNSRGVTTTAARWLVADGEAGGPGQASTYVLVANTGATAQPIAITLLPEQGTPRTVSAVVSGNGRFTIDVAGTFPEVAEGRFGVLVEGSSPTAPLVVERASYASTPSTPWAAGTNSLALPLP